MTRKLDSHPSASRAIGLCLFLFVCCVACAMPFQAVGAAGGERPNIILIMSDDMGFSDLGCYGGEIKTPVLDSLAAEGIRFTQFYNTARCCPTRASLLTGLYPHQAGIGHMMEDRGLEGYQGDLNNRSVTIAQVLRSAGYRTYMTGKWHVTKKVNPDGESQKHNWPLQRGFDRFFGTIHGAGSFYDPNSLTRDNQLIAPDSPDFFYTDAISDNAAGYIRDHARQHQETPFFMYVAYTAAHWPMHARPENIAKYEGAYDAGWDAIRRQRYERMIAMGLIDPQWKLSPRDRGVPAWEDEPLKEWNIRCMEVYAAMVDCMDQGIGRIVASLKETGLEEDTLILFLQDNGGCAEGMGRGREVTYRADPNTIEPMQPGELQYDMIPKRTRDGRAVRQGQGVMPGPADTYIGYGLPWANVSNTPFREYKHWVHEGGISTPLIARWPAGIAGETGRRGEGETGRRGDKETGRQGDGERGRQGDGERGRLLDTPAHLIDIMATCVDLAGASYPTELNGNRIHPLEGRSLRPLFNGQPFDRPNPIFWEHEGNRAVRVDNWKLVAKGADSPWELYDLASDRTELSDLAAQHPERVRDLAEAWDAWAERAHVKPWPWDRKEAAKKKKAKKP